ncbi:hypothetical protein HBH70_230070 [Parastagonospora nodorum]|nr:hypothetical protein HBH52_215710 [Parastagonospora nodorum]KAH4010566.1 hypothetical protein HBI09_230300 [Parastagonospora nodorum]KAH4080531.1 hypothetical protein HBH46_228940 [Parastagonospora nodorum]KAH4152089.1 hypothetical protein HBH43_236160 [Parastagonospora nodorum]KAH4193767.1 hypothetical protein HBH42_105120 [Parastagonospora nodorum]
MKVLIIGATGNFGVRLVPALLAHGHHVVAFVRSASKLESLLPDSLHCQITVVGGSAKDSGAVKNAIIDHGCDAVVNTAGLSAVAPWAHTDLPVIFRSVVEAVREAGKERAAPVRAWFLGGQGVLNFPGTKIMMSSYVPIFLEHRENYNLLRSLPSDSIEWSMFCPNTMVPESASPTTTVQSKLVASADVPPLWKDSWIKHIPLIGRTLVCAINAMRYRTTLEQSAEFIAADLESHESPWVGRRVGTIKRSR